MKRLAIFDLDGTLLNTITDLGASTNFALAKMGYPEHPLSAYNYTWSETACASLWNAPGRTLHRKR